MERKPIFDTVRRLLGRGFTPAEVAILDRAIDEAVGEVNAGSSLPQLIGAKGVALIKQFEGCSRLRNDGMIDAYPDPGTGGEPWTIGWGTTQMGGRKVRPGDRITQARADALLEEQLVSFASEVVKALEGAPTTQAQFDALVSFHYNTGAIARASLTRKHCAGDYEGAACEFARWNRAGGQVLRGLARRREAEAMLYRTG